MILKVLKRDGRTEDFNVDKLNNIVKWACEGYNANPSDILMKTQQQLFSNIKTTKIHEVLVKSSIDLISAKTPDYQYVASRLFSFFVRKQIFGVCLDEDMPHLIDVIEMNVDNGYYSEDVRDKFNSDELDQLNSYIKHSYDDKLEIAAYKKLHSSYFVRNRKTGYVYETPQYAFMVVAIVLNDTIQEVKDFYKALVNREISLPTPVMAGVRTPIKQYASCTLIDVDDNLESMYSSAHAVGRFVSRKAGIGLNGAKWRGLGAGIRNGDVIHTGVIPFLKFFQGATKSCSQGGNRDGSSTIGFPVWHTEILDIIVLKNNKGTDDNRVKNLDYSIQMTGLFWKRMLKNETISLFHSHETPKLIETWGYPEFDKAYTEYEADKSIYRKEINGQDLLVAIVTERLNTGRLYIQNIDNANLNTPFIDQITMSNLCITGDSLVDIRIKADADLSYLQLDRKNDDYQYGKLPIDIIVNIGKLHQFEEFDALSYNVDAKKYEYKKIRAVGLTKRDAELYLIEDTESGKSIRCTAEHKIYTVNRGYVMAKDLLETDELLIS